MFYKRDLIPKRAGRSLWGQDRQSAIVELVDRHRQTLDVCINYTDCHNLMFIVVVIHRDRKKL